MYMFIKFSAVQIKLEMTTNNMASEKKIRINISRNNGVSSEKKVELISLSSSLEDVLALCSQVLGLSASILYT